MTDTVLRKTIYLNASKEHVWSYLTDPDKLAVWFHKPKAPLTAGAPYQMFGTTSGDRLMWGDVTRAEPFDLLEYTFTIGPMNGAVSTVRWMLEAVAGGTRLSLRHEGLPQGADAFGLALALDKGWDDHISKMRAAIHEAAA
ncbi:MAG: SRPBCC domain-containing protein [Alphaproteobacteria bacterium]|nr:SRPBCC domain-containing protein [Alphaproteobacteria bacterium]NNF23571.1 SRPBCC domain-containing protein [Paracoccaceae bacterium]